MLAFWETVLTFSERLQKAKVWNFAAAPTWLADLIHYLYDHSTPPVICVLPRSS